MEKSPDAFRTISEVADWLGVPTHVLRFWESRFPQVKPVKRAGGRRYYRPADMTLLGGIKRLLHDDGMTIRGVQKMLREEGVRHVSSYSQPLDSMGPLRDVTPDGEEVAPSPMAVDVEPEPLDNVVPLATAPEVADEERRAAPPAPEHEDEAAPDLVDEATLAPRASPEPGEAGAFPGVPELIDEATLAPRPAPERGDAAAFPPPPELVDEEALAPQGAPEPDPMVAGSGTGEADRTGEDEEKAEPVAEDEAAALAPAAATEEPAPPAAAPPPGSQDEDRSRDTAPPAAVAEEPAPPAAPRPPQTRDEDEAIPEFSFLRRGAPTPASAAAPPAPEPDLFSSGRVAEPAPPRPRIPATPGVPARDAADDDAAIPARPGVAARILVHGIRPDHAAIARAVGDLHALRARL
jgi:resuscitation-promoting factor RpfA